MKNRRSIRDYTSRDVSKRTLKKILEAATWAPSAHNAQPWRFIVIRDLALKLKLAATMANHWKKNMAKNGVSERYIDHRLETSMNRFTTAPIVIIPCLTMVDMHNYSDKRRRKIEYLLGVQSVAAAIENILIATHVIGLGACWYCAPLFCPDTARKVLNIPPDFDPQALITLGYPAHHPEPPNKKSVEKTMCIDVWSEF